MIESVVYKTCTNNICSFMHSTHNILTKQITITSLFPLITFPQFFGLLPPCIPVQFEQVALKKAPEMNGIHPIRDLAFRQYLHIVRHTSIPNNSWYIHTRIIHCKEIVLPSLTIELPLYITRYHYINCAYRSVHISCTSYI
jgi:hypothetical protein